MLVVAVAMDLEAGAVQQLWCPDAACTAHSVLQTTYAHEAFPHAVVTELLLNNSGGASPLTLSLTPAPVQPEMSRVAEPEQANSKFGKGMDCMKWKHTPLSIAPSTHTLSVGVLAAANKKGGSVSLAVAAHSAPAQLHAPAHGMGGSATGGALVLVSSRWSSAEAPKGDAVAATKADMQLLLGLAGNGSATLWLQHEAAFAQRRLRGGAAGGGAPISVEGNPGLALLLNASWYALMGTAPRPEAELNRFGTGISSLNTNGYNGRTFWDMDIWVAPNFLLFGPDGAADGCIAFRYDEMPIAQHCASMFKYKGLDYPWDVCYGATVKGTRKAQCPEDGNGHTEIHIGTPSTSSFLQF